MIPRHAQAALRELAAGYPIVALTGPRQSGKTTLARAVFAERPYVSLERLAARAPEPRVDLTRYHGVCAPNAARSARS
jgi:hypothetical protein